MFQVSKDVLHLRRVNRILSVGSTTAIEGNRLTVQQVFDVINGKVVFASLHDIKEVIFHSFNLDLLLHITFED